MVNLIINSSCSSGTLNIFVLIGVVIYFASEWGINVEFNDFTSPMYIPWGSGTVYCLSGTLSMGMFIHNAIITITSRQGAKKENNVRIICMMKAKVKKTTSSV